MNAALHRKIVDGRYYLDGKPLLIVGGELLNSSSSTPAAIDRSLDTMAALGVNTVLAPVAWESIEPKEGAFDWSLVDHLHAAAVRRDLHLIPLWFGTWKNGMSTYAPAWVKVDTARFPRIETPSTGRTESVTPFSPEGCAADGNAFSAFMRRLRELDDGRTILLVQVENEVGVLGDARDHCPEAQLAWQQPVPDGVISAVDDAGEGRLRAAWTGAGSPRASSWDETFGAEAPEAFMAYEYAKYVEAVAALGRREYDIPLYANAWVDANAESDGGNSSLLLAGGVMPGVYPSGGPLRHTAPIWRSTAPTLDLLAPDIYFGSFDAIAAEYRAIDDVLFIPEMMSNRVGIGHMFQAVGAHGAMGVSPFGIDELPDSNADLPYLRDAFRVLRGVGQILASLPGASAHGFTLTPDDRSTHFDADDVRFEITADHLEGVFPPDYPGYGCIIHTAPDTVFVAGRGFAVTPTVQDGRVGILTAEELEWHGADWRVTRRLNGDEAGRTVRVTSLHQKQLELFPIPQNLRSTGIVRIKTYRY